MFYRAYAQPTRLGLRKCVANRHVNNVIDIFRPRAKLRLRTVRIDRDLHLHKIRGDYPRISILILRPPNRLRYTPSARETRPLYSGPPPPEIVSSLKQFSVRREHGYCCSSADIESTAFHESLRYRRTAGRKCGRWCVSAGPIRIDKRVGKQAEWNCCQMLDDCQSAEGATVPGFPVAHPPSLQQRPRIMTRQLNTILNYFVQPVEIVRAVSTPFRRRLHTVVGDLQVNTEAP